VGSEERRHEHSSEQDNQLEANQEVLMASLKGRKKEEEEEEEEEEAKDHIRIASLQILGISRMSWLRTPESSTSTSFTVKVQTPFGFSPTNSLKIPV
jgi:hypothetical protein